MGKGETNTNSDNSTSEVTTETETTEQPTKENKQDLDSIRTVIKVNEEESPSGEERKEESPVQETSEKTDASNPPKAPQPAAIPPVGSKDEAERTRNILQSMKDFDLQIKKNQEDIGKLVEKLDGQSNDLDDLVSLYEIVSEQMNPFVGLSKVTKKRIDALENFTKEVESLRTRIGDMESVLEKNKFNIKGPKRTEALPEASKIVDESEFGSETAISTGGTVSKSFAPTAFQYIERDLSDENVENIVNTSFEVLFAEQNIDNTINEFLLSLK